MKNLFVMLFTVLSLNSYAQLDTIYLKSETKVLNVKIIEVNPTNLKYKKDSNLEGPLYTIEKTKIDKVVFQNGDIEIYSNEDSKSEIKSIETQASLELIPGSRLFLSYALTKNEENVDGNDAKAMLKDYIEGKTSCVVVNTIDEDDFIIELRVIKKIMADRSAKITISNILSNTLVYESEWARGSSTAFSGYSGSRASIGKVVKNQLLEKYPKIKI